MSEPIILKKGMGRLTCVFSEGFDDRSQLSLQIEKLSDFDLDLSSFLLMYIEEKFEKIGFLGSVYIDGNDRGKGIGKHLMNEFENKVSSKTDIDFLYARIDNPQDKGFDLFEFYEKRGFEAVKYSNGELLMVNKGHANEIKREVFGIYHGNYKAGVNKEPTF
jgi:ribosomal protein S18 acetylase RimI-like enzyme